MAGAVEAAADVSARVRADRLQVLFRQAPPAIVSSVVIAGIVCVALWDVGDRVLLRWWLEGVVFLAAVRFAVVWSHARARTRSDAKAELRWEGWFVGSTILVAASWGIGGWMLMPASSLAHQAILYFFIVAIAGGSVSVYSAQPSLVAATLCLVALPATLRLLLFDPLPLRLMALGGLLFMLASYRATALLAASQGRFHELSYELAIAHARAQELARTDELTGLRNRRTFVELAEQSLHQANRYGRPASAIMLDIDHFKTINDTHGHAAGDDVLRVLAGIIVRAAVRASDVAGRLGGEEFAILLPETTLDDAVALAERLRAAVKASSVPTAAAAIRFSASFGVAERAPRGESLDQLLARADAALYQAKHDGRDRVRKSPLPS